MAKLRIRFRLNEGRRGAPLDKLGRIAEQSEKFLRALAADCGLHPKPGEWLAADFENHSVQYDAEFQGAVDPGAAQIFERSMEFLADFDPDREGLNGVVRDSTALEYAKIGELIDPDEQIGVGIIPFRGGIPKWRAITYSKSERIKIRVETPIPTYATKQGIIHAWFKEARTPYFQFRELASDGLIRVEYGQVFYPRIAAALRERSLVLIIGGECAYDRVSRAAMRMKLDRLHETRALSTAEFDAIFGSFPEFTPGEWEDAV